MFSLSGALETFRRYLLIRTDILQKTLDGCPCFVRNPLPNHELRRPMLYSLLMRRPHLRGIIKMWSNEVNIQLLKQWHTTNVNRHYSLNFSKFCNKNNWPQCLVVFSIVILRFSAIRNLLSDSVSLFEFPLIRVKATCILDSEATLLEAKKKNI